MEHLSSSQVAELLKKEGFPEDVVQLLADKAVDGKALMMLETDEDMKELGFKKLGDRLKIKKFKSYYKGATNTTKLPLADHHKQLVSKNNDNVSITLYYSNVAVFFFFFFFFFFDWSKCVYIYTLMFFGVELSQTLPHVNADSLECPSA